MAIKNAKIEHADLLKIRKIINHFGQIPQKLMVLEEMGELGKEVLKSLRGSNNRDKIIDEIGDVTLMLKQLQIIYNIPDFEIEEVVEHKMNRTIERIDSLC